MSYAATATASTTETYSVLDIETVMRRVLGDLLMIASSSASITEAKAREYAHDIELLAKKGYLRSADITLISGSGLELRAACYDVNTEAGNLTMSRPGGVMWPRVNGAWLRVVLSFTDKYNDAARSDIARRLKIGWAPTNTDTSHVGLSSSGGRDYASRGYGIQRKDFGS
ncbi:MAG: hypothetical protein ACLPPF_24175 [Rhodomicrobium sp.]